MNCAELQQDIDNLKNDLESVKGQFEHGSENGRIASSFARNLQATDSEGNDRLNKYYEIFREKNPKEFKYSTKYNIEGCRDAEGAPTSIATIAPLSDGSMLLGGGRGALLHCYKKDRKWQVENLVNSNIDYGISSMLTVSDDTVLIGRYTGKIQSCHKRNGHWELGEEIEGLAEIKKPSSEKIVGMVPLQDGNILISTINTVYHCHQENGRWQIDNSAEVFSKDLYSDSPKILSVTALQDGSVIIKSTGQRGNNSYYHYHKKDDYWDIEKILDDHKTEIKTVTPLPNDDLLVGEHDGSIARYKYSDGEWHWLEFIETPSRGLRSFFAVESIIIDQKNNNIIIGDEENVLWVYHIEKGKWTLVNSAQYDDEFKANNNLFLSQDGDILISSDNNKLFYYTSSPDIQSVVPNIIKNHNS